jgi:hypothetical protein
LAAWILSYFPRVLTLVQKTWPEQILLLGWLVWQGFDLPLAALPLLGLGLTARLFLLLRWGLGLVRRAAAEMSSPSSGTPPA